MNIKKLFLIAALVVVSYSIFSFATVHEQPTDIIEKNIHEPFKIIDLFFKAVDRGELTVFGQILDRTVLTPLRVEYIYELDGSKPTVNIYSAIKKLIYIPGHEGIRLHGISAILDGAGRIIEVKAHVISD